MPKLPSGVEPKVGRMVKVDLAKWEECMALADENGETISDVVRRAVDSYISKHRVRPSSSR